MFNLEKGKMGLKPEIPSKITDTDGSTSIEVVEDIIILKGKKEDVDQVQQAIEKLEAPQP
ncbi:MAG: hypothetical protein ACKVH8_23710 [Pirellulales bacterium]